MKNLFLVIGIVFTSFSFAAGPIDGKVYGKANLSIVNHLWHANEPGCER